MSQTPVQTQEIEWSALIGPLIHSTKISILEALLWIGRPLSATDLEKVFDGTPSLGLASYHLKSLAAIGVLSCVEKRKVRGTWESFYYFAGDR